MSAEVQCVKQSIRFFRLLFQLPRILVPSSPGCEAKGDTVLFWLLTLEAGLLKRLKFQPGDRAEKTSFNLVRKKLTFYRWKAVTFALVRCKGKPPTSREPYMIIITECVGVFDLPRLMVTGTHMWTKKGCVYLSNNELEPSGADFKWRGIKFEILPNMVTILMQWGGVARTPAWQCMWDKSVCHIVAYVAEPFPIELLYESPSSLSKRNGRFS